MNPKSAVLSFMEYPPVMPIVAISLSAKAGVAIRAIMAKAVSSFLMPLFYTLS